MTKRKCCSVRCPQRNSPDTRYPPGAADTTAIAWFAIRLTSCW